MNISLYRPIGKGLRLTKKLVCSSIYQNYEEGKKKKTKKKKCEYLGLFCHVKSLFYVKSSGILGKIISMAAAGLTLLFVRCFKKKGSNNVLYSKC